MENVLNNSDSNLTNVDKQTLNAAEKSLGAMDVAITILEDLQRVVSKGSPKTVKIRLGDKVIAEMPVALTAAAAIAAGLAAVLLTKLAIDIEHEE